MKNEDDIIYVFRGKRINLKKGYFRSPNGTLSYREIVEHPGSVVIIPVTNDGKILFIKQYRHGIGEWILELPAGTLEKNEDPLNCAYRELIEETGYKAGKMLKLFEMYVSPGYTTEYMYVFLATDLQYVGSKPDVGEIIDLVEVGIDEAIKYIKENTIRDAKSIATILYYFLIYQK